MQSVRTRSKIAVTILALLAILVLLISGGAQKNTTSGWIPDATNGVIPNRAARGMIHGEPFTVQSAELSGGSPKDQKSNSGGHWTYTLSLRQGKGFFADKSFDISIVTKPGEKLDSKIFKVKPGSTFNQANHVKD